MAVDWYAMQSKPNKEEALFELLTRKEIEVYFPRIRVHPVNPRARKIKAYFPGYMFVHIDLREIGISTLQWMPFARGIVSFDHDPSVVPEALITTLKRKVSDVNLAGGEVFEGLQKGDNVVIEEGPFAGYGAIFDTRLSGNERVRVLIELLSHRQVPLELGVSQISQKKPKK